MQALLWTTCLVGACEPEEPSEVSEPTTSLSKTPNTAGATSETSRTLVTAGRSLMGTRFQISVLSASSERANRIMEEAFDEMARLEALLSEWQPDSEISRINQMAGVRPVHVRSETLRVVQAGLRVSRWSQGAFDLSWAALRGMYKFQPNERTLPDMDEIQRRLSLVRWQDVLVDEDKGTVFLKRKGMAIGTGGIGKGYALDRAAEILRAAGFDSYMLFGGGQVQVHGLKFGRAWRVGVQHPRRTALYFGHLELTDGSVSTSGDYEHFFVHEGKRWHHIIDPRTGLPSNASVSTTVIAPDGLYSDALSTAAFIMGPVATKSMLARIPYHAELVAIDPQLRLHMTAGAKAAFVAKEGFNRRQLH